MKHNLRRVLHLTTARDFTVRAVRAWRKLLPDWTPTLDMLRDLDTRPHEHIAAVRIVATGWEANDPRWDVLMALLEWERRDVRDEEYCKNLAASIQPLPEQSSNVTYLPEDQWGEMWECTPEPDDPPAEESSDEPEGAAPLCPPGECTWPDCGCPEIEQPPVRSEDERRERVVIPFKVVNRAGQVFHSGETTVETPLKASFLDRLTPVKHLREKNTDA